MNTPPPWNPPLHLDSASDWGHVRDAAGELIFIVRRRLDDLRHENECRRCGIDPTEDRANYILFAIEERDFRLNDALAKLRESDAQIVALREALELIKDGCKEDFDYWHKYPHLRENVIGGVAGNRAIAAAALSSPAPACVPLEEAQSLADALLSLRDEQNGAPLERRKEHWQAAYDGANKLLDEWSANHPVPESDPYQSEDYQRFVAKTAENCTADDAPCDACLAGGYCDGPSHEAEHLPHPDDEKD